jgi:hypothetical protein
MRTLSCTPSVRWMTQEMSRLPLFLLRRSYTSSNKSTGISSLHSSLKEDNLCLPKGSVPITNNRSDFWLKKCHQLVAWKISKQKKKDQNSNSNRFLSRMHLSNINFSSRMRTITKFFRGRMAERCKSLPLDWCRRTASISFKEIRATVL